MKAELLSRFHLPWIPLTALLIFFTFFVVMVFWVYRSRSGELYSRMEKLPLEEEDNYERKANDQRR